MKCPYCGCDETVKKETFYFCEGCERTFGSEPVTDSGEKLIDAVKGLRFSDEDENSKMTIRIAYEPEGNVYLYEIYEARDGKIDKMADIMDIRTFDKIMDTLLNKLFVYDWDPIYYPVIDGSNVYVQYTWKLDLIMADGEEITRCGYEAVPAPYKKLLAVFKPYSTKFRNK